MLLFLLDCNRQRRIRKRCVEGKISDAADANLLLGSEVEGQYSCP